VGGRRGGGIGGGRSGGTGTARDPLVLQRGEARVTDRHAELGAVGRPDTRCEIEVKDRGPVLAGTDGTKHSLALIQLF